VFASLGKATANFFDGTLKGVILKSALITFGVFLLLLVAVEYGLSALPQFGPHWIKTSLEVLAPVLIVLLVFYVGAPVAALFASLFLDQVASKVEQRAYPHIASKRGASAYEQAWVGLRFSGLMILLNLLLLPFDIELPGLAELAALLVNGWLLGREYFELVALRHLSGTAARALRARYRGRFFAAGLLLAILTMIPLVNLFAPLFGVALMVHMVQRISEEKTA
jgi:CysZ protein